jgi:hypothetical protein
VGDAEQPDVAYAVNAVAMTATKALKDLDLRNLTKAESSFTAGSQTWGKAGFTKWPTLLKSMLAQPVLDGFFTVPAGLG